MIKFIFIMIFMSVVTFFAILNPQPVAMSVFPGEVMLVPLRLSVLAAIILGAAFAGIPAAWRRVKLRSRLNSLTRENKELKSKIGGEKNGEIREA